MLAPLVPLVMLVGGVAAGLSPGVVVLLLVLLLVMVGVAVIGITSPGVVVRDGRLSVRVGRTGGARRAAASTSLSW